MEWFQAILIILLLAFWVWMFADMLKSRMSTKDKAIWAMFFLIFAPSVLFWWFVR